MDIRDELFDPDPMRQIVFRVFSGSEFYGTGFFISEEGWALTCWHVIPSAVLVDPLSPVPVEWHGSARSARFCKAFSNELKDIAVLKFDADAAERFPTLPMVAMPPKLLRNLG